MPSKKVSITGSNFGDVVVGDKNVGAPTLTSLEKAIQSIKESVQDDVDLVEIIEELEEYVTDKPDREVIGVKAKLENGGRQELVEKAIYYKSKFARKLAKNQMSLVEQKVYAHALASIIVAFDLKVRPVIADGESNSMVDAAIHDSIIEPTYGALVGFDAQIKSDLVAGMVYFLTGKCHLNWEK